MQLQKPKCYLIFSFKNCLRDSTANMHLSLTNYCSISQKVKSIFLYIFSIRFTKSKVSKYYSSGQNAGCKSRSVGSRCKLRLHGMSTYILCSGYGLINPCLQRISVKTLYFSTFLYTNLTLHSSTSHIVLSSGYCAGCKTRVTGFEYQCESRWIPI